MKRLFLCGAMLAAMGAATAFPAARAKEVVAKPGAGGLLPPTAEERAWADAHMIRTEAVLLNELGLSRVNAERAKRKLAPLAGRRLSSEDVSRDAAMDDHVREARSLSSSLAKGEVLVARDGCEALGYAPLRSKGGADESGIYEPPSDAYLPSAVDNSPLPSFPPIRSQGAQGSCASFSTTYYMATHMTGLARGWNAKADPFDAHKFSPKWTYNLVNGGSNGGSSIPGNVAVLMEQGCALWAQFPYSGLTSPATEYTEWCADPQVWRGALSHRFLLTGTVSQDDDPDFTLLKTLLSDGYVLAGGRFGDALCVAAGDNPATAADDALVGEPLFACTTYTPWGHAQTIVGYNDDVWCDLNGNGAVDPGELGAFKAADSGFSGTGGCGYNWFAYDALRTQTAVAGWTPPANRRTAFDSKTWIVARASYTPRFVAEFTLKHAKRKQIVAMTGSSAPSAASPHSTRPITALCWAGGALGFDGLDYSANPSAAPAFTFCADFSDTLPANCSTRWYLGFKDYASDGCPGSMTNARITESATGQAWSLLPASVSANGSTAWAMTDYTGPAFLITAGAGDGGAVRPGGAVPAFPGTDMTFTVTPAFYATIADVIVDGVSKGPLASYTFHDVAWNHTIQAVFSFATRYVSPSGGNQPPYDTWAKAARSIRDAVGLGTHAKIVVGDGTYQEGQAVSVAGPVYVTSLNGPSAATILGDPSHPCLDLLPGAVVEGLTVRGGEPYGVYAAEGTLSNCVVTQNAGVGVWLAGGVCSRCEITGNLDSGVYAEWGEIWNSLIAGNAAAQSGGGIYCPSEAFLLAVHCTVAGNSAPSEGGGSSWIRRPSSSPRAASSGGTAPRSTRN